ncbi:MAG: sensor histidine kinase, partial [Clostridiales bacterium]|nr:sensor histidine kinase [Clostridiales bacterium]
FSGPLQKDNSILDIIIYVKKTGQVITYSRNYRKTITGYNFGKFDWFTDVLRSGGNLRLIPTYQTDYMDSDNRLVYTAITSLFDNSGETVGVLMINLDAKALGKAYSAYAGDVKGTIIITDAAGNVFFDSSNRYYGTVYPYFSKLKATNDFLELDQQSIVSVAYSERNNLNVVGIVPKAEIDKSTKSIMKNIYFILMGCILASLGLVYFTSKYFSSRIMTIKAAMKEVEEGRLNIRIRNIKGNDEIQQISNGFNNMCSRLGEYIDREYVSEIRTKQAELAALQAQIDPHFLYNTLEVIRMQALIDGSDTTSEMVFALANLFRANVKNRSNLVSIGNELDYCKAYLDIIKTKYMDRLRFRTELADGVMDRCIPKFILQPVVENSIKYGGLDSGLDTLTITIRGELCGKDVEISVADDGNGMTQTELESIRRSLKFRGESPENEKFGSLGLININERIRLIFGEPYGVRIDSRQGGGTVIIIRIPSKSIEEAGMDVQNSAGR